MVGMTPMEMTARENARQAVAHKALRVRGNQLLALTRDMRAADLGDVEEAALFERVTSFLGKSSTT